MSSPITCHVLNTLSGTPASNLKATLTLLSTTNSSLPKASSDSGAQESSVSFSATTNEDGRVKDWISSTSHTVNSALGPFAAGEKVPFSIRFEIGSWYEAQGIDCFWPEIEVKFYVKKGERHYHVPVLVGPWTYTTYRGS
jgi:5-hydroxyisourate hydrolase